MMPNLIKKIVFGCLVLLLVLIGFDYAKHVYLLRTLKNDNPDMVFEDDRVTFDDKAFRVWADKVTFPQGSCDKVRLRIPFFSFSQVILKINDLEVNGASLEKVRGVLTKNDHGVEIESMECRGGSYKLADALMTVDNITLNGVIDKHAILLTLFAKDVKRNGSTLFNFSMTTNLHHAFTEQGKGQIKVRVSNFRKFLALLSEENLTNGLKLSLIEAAFGDNVAIPLDLRGRKLFLGPIKLVELPEEMKPLFS